MMNTTPSLTQRRRRRYVAAQSLTVAIIVLFLLLFLGGLFIALIINNLRNVKKAAEGVASDKFAQAGIAYLDDQLTKSPEGADWRPLPYVADPNDTDGNGNYDSTDSNGDGRRNAEPLRTGDPDYEWLKPCGAGVSEPCGYSRATFGGPTPSSGNLGGRALVKIVYRPDYTGTVGSTSSKYLKLLSIGRVGNIDPTDPTTFQNSEGKGQRRERLAAKAIGLVENLIHITNKNDRPTVAALGAINKVLEAPYGSPRPTTAPMPREIESVYYGSIHSNAPLTFFGVNRLLLDGNRGDAITVSSSLDLSGVSRQAASQNATDVSRVYLTDPSASLNNAAVLPSGSANFNTFGGRVRDNAPQSGDNLRHVVKTTAPLIDENIGSNGLTRYKLLTRDSQPMDPKFVSANPIGDPPNWTTQSSPQYPARVGWGAGLYLDNREDLQNASESLIGAYSPRANWTGADPRWWNGDNRYVPPAVVITLTPRYMIIQRSTTSVNRSFFRDNTGRRINQTTILRYSGLGNGSTDAQVPTAGVTQNVRKFEGYPAEPAPGIGPNVWSGDYVVYAEGNIRIRGVAGGLDPETQRYYVRHLSFISNGNIYVDGNLLKDNIPDSASGTAAAVRGRSSLALLAKNYVVVNTTQFLSPGDNVADHEAPGADATAIFLKPDSPQFDLRLVQGPAQTYGPAGQPTGRVAPSAFYGAGLEYAPSMIIRHSAAGIDGSTAVNLQINDSFFRFPVDLAWPNANPPLTTLAMGGPTSAEAGVYFDSVFALKDNANNPNHLYAPGDHVAPFTQAADFGMDNRLALNMDVSAGVPNQTNYRLSRFGVVPLDIRIEALMYAQEGSFFIIPGPWFNPDPNDTYEAYLTRQARAGENLVASGRGRIDPLFPFYGQPLDVRITIFGAITENLPAEVGDQSAWLEKWGWVPHYYGSSGLPSATGYPAQGNAVLTLHGVHSDTLATGGLPGPKPGGNGGGSGIVYQYDDRLVSPYIAPNTPLRTDEFGNILPAAPRLPVAPGLLYSGETPEA